MSGTYHAGEERRWIALLWANRWKLWQLMPVLRAMLLPGVIRRAISWWRSHDEKGRYTVVIEKGAPACHLLQCFRL